MSKKEVAKKETTAVSTQVEDLDHSEILSGDVLIPRLLLMQGLSELVAQRKAQQGDIVKSLTVEKVGDPETPVEIIPLKFDNAWTNTEYVNGKYEYRSQEPRTAANDDLPWDYEQNGAKWKRVKTVNVFALILGDIEGQVGAGQDGGLPDLDKVLLPVVISFRSTSFPAGKAVVTHFAKAKAMAHLGAKPWGYSLTLSCMQTKNEKGIFYIYTIQGKAKPVKKEILAEAEGWVKRLASSKVKIDDEKSESELTTGEGQF